MFVKIKDEDRIINLNNFDMICIECDDYPMHEAFYVVARRATLRLRGTHSGGHHAANSSFISGSESVAIKKFENRKEAQAFYDKLTECWISNDSPVFLVE